MDRKKIVSWLSFDAAFMFLLISGIIYEHEFAANVAHFLGAFMSFILTVQILILAFSKDENLLNTILREEQYPNKFLFYYAGVSTMAEMILMVSAGWLVGWWYGVCFVALKWIIMIHDEQGSSDV